MGWVSCSLSSFICVKFLCPSPVLCLHFIFRQFDLLSSPFFIPKERDRNLQLEVFKLDFLSQTIKMDFLCGEDSYYLGDPKTLWGDRPSTPAPLQRPHSFFLSHHSPSVASNANRCLAHRQLLPPRPARPWAEAAGGTQRGLWKPGPRCLAPPP